MIYGLLGRSGVRDDRSDGIRFSKEVVLRRGVPLPKNHGLFRGFGVSEAARRPVMCKVFPPKNKEHRWWPDAGLRNKLWF